LNVSLGGLGRYGASVPLDALIKVPNTLTVPVALQVVLAYSMPLPVHPGTLITAAVRPDEHAPPVFFVAVVFSLVTASVWPAVDSLSVNHVVLPLPLEGASVSPLKNPFSLHTILHPGPVVVALVLPGELPLSILLASTKLALKCVAVEPNVTSVTERDAVGPLAGVLGTRGVKECALSVLLVVLKLSLVIVPVCVVELSQTLSLALEPLPLVLRPIHPLLHSETVLDIVLKLALVFSTAIESDLGNFALLGH
jgi:hypothetical protein